MELLHFLENLRTPIGDTFFSLITHLGEETIFILLGIVFFWCIDKKQGYYLLSIGFIGTILNQFLKLLFRIPRPWVKDENFTIVESARKEATGYSFPSGHTQSSIGIFGGIARWNKNTVLRVVGIILCILIPFSRMYLGVHTPLDVGVSSVIALILIFVLYPIAKKSVKKPKNFRILLFFMTAFSLSYLLFVLLYKFPADTDIANLENGTKNAYKMLGCTLGILLAFEIDTRFIKFETRATFLGQILKLILGLIPVILIKSLLKTPLYALFGGSFIADSVRYFLLCVFAGCIWPLTFKYFSKIGLKN